MICGLTLWCILACGPVIGCTTTWMQDNMAHFKSISPVPAVVANKHYPHGRCCTIARRSDNLQACVCVASSHHFPCVPAVRLCVARLASTFLALWPSCSACVRACCSSLGFLSWPSLSGGAVTEVLHDLLCGLALSTVRHDLPSKKKKKKKNMAHFTLVLRQKKALSHSVLGLAQMTCFCKACCHISMTGI